jgi:hypothetical protein
MASACSTLLKIGVDHFHFCDSEFNLPLTHAKEICRAITSHRLNDRLRWYCYCSPVPFDRELARLMKRGTLRFAVLTESSELGFHLRALIAFDVDRQR